MRKSILLTVLLSLSMSGLFNVAYADDLDMTARIQNPSFEQGTDGWTQTNFSWADNGNFTLVDGNYFLEKWVWTGAVGSASVQQILSGLPAGHYRLTAAAQNIQQGDLTEEQTGANIFAGSTNTVVKAPADYSVSFSTTGTDVKIGFKATNATGNWISVDHFRLAYVSADLALLQTATTNAESTITTSEKSSYAGLQPLIKSRLQAAIAAAQTATEATSEEDLRPLAFELAESHALAKVNMDALKSLKSLVTKSNSMLKNDMAAIYHEALQAANNEAVELLKLETNDPPQPVVDRLQTAYDNAEASYKARKALNTSITAAHTQLDKEASTEGKEDLAAAIAVAEAVRDSETATPEEMTQAKKVLDDAILFYRIQNATGKVMTVKTLSAVQGASEIFGRATFSGATAKETGFCWSEDPYPTIYDNRSSTSYSNNGDIYAMQGLKPATVYYVRAYAITSGYQLSYGDVLKVPTRPLGNVTYNYDNAGDEATNKRINDACEEAVWMWNNITGIRGFHLDAHYVPGAGASGGTADCSYGGYMRISQNVPYQKTGTVLHEGSHSQGVINYTEWVDGTYRTNGDRGDWLGPRVDRVIQFLENSATAKLHGDDVHLWPYGINGSNEDTGSPILYRANALIVGALAEDAITTPNMDFKKPAYSFVQDDDTKYYIKSESPSRGLATSYLRYTNGTNVRFAEATADEAFADDSYAWYITFDPATCYYKFKNAYSGRYLSMTSGAVSASMSPSASFQLMGSRTETTYNDFTFAGSSYWVLNSSNHNAMQATTTGASSATFNHQNSATTQRWLFLTADEVSRFAQAQGETVGISRPKAATLADVNVLSGQGVIAVTAVGEGQDVQIYAADGRLMRRLYVQRDATAQVRVPRGLYLVNGKKVLVR